MKKILASLLAFVMVLTLVPAAWAAVGDTDTTCNGGYEGDVWSRGGNGALEYMMGDSHLRVTKTARPVEGQPTKFDIDLTVEVERPNQDTQLVAATVLVMDNSLSMSWCAECGHAETHAKKCPYYNADSNAVKVSQTPLFAAKQAAKNFLDGDGVNPGYADGPEGSGHYLAIVSYSEEAKVRMGWYDVTTDEGYAAAVAAIDGLDPYIGTNLDAGIYQAYRLMEEWNSSELEKAQKNVIVLSDGVPNESRAHPVELHVVNYGDAVILKDTKKTAAKMRNLAQIYTIASGNVHQKCYIGGPEAGEFMRDSIATPATAENTYAFEAEDLSALIKAFADITDSVMKDVEEGTLTVTDPMGNYILAPGAKTVTADGSVVRDGNGFRWTLADPEVIQSGDATTIVHLYRMSYRVTADVEKDGYPFGEFIPANMPTDLHTPNGDFPFPVPGVLVPDSENPGPGPNPDPDPDPDPNPDPDPENPVDPEDPTDPTNPTDPTDPEDPADPSNPENPDKPETGDNGVALWATLLVTTAAGAVALYTLKKKSRKEN